ncbi:MAG: hypothetical protein WDW38_003645 [Sanguina aurantia]
MLAGSPIELARLAHPSSASAPTNSSNSSSNSTSHPSSTRVDGILTYSMATQAAPPAHGNGHRNPFDHASSQGHTDTDNPFGNSSGGPSGTHFSTSAADNPFGSCGAATRAGQQAAQSREDGGFTPTLDLPELQTGMGEDQLKDLAFMVFAGCSIGTAHAPLIDVLRQQLEVDGERAKVLLRLMRHVSGGAWTSAQRATLQMLVTLLEVVRPCDFDNKYKPFVRWREGMVSALEASLAKGVAGAWMVPEPGSAQKLTARLRACVRRMDARTPDDFDEAEYSEAVAALKEAASRLAAGCSSGWKYPWALRVRLGEILTSAIFDTLDESTYIDEAALVLQFYEHTLWPLLGLTPAVHLAMSAWVHFRQYVSTGEQRLVKQLKSSIAKLAAEMGPSQAAAAGVQLHSHRKGWQPQFLTSRVAVVTGRPQGLLEVLNFACRARGDGDPQVFELLVEAISASVTEEFQRRSDAVNRGSDSAESQLLSCARICREVLRAESDFGNFLSNYLPEATAVAAVRLYSLYGGMLQAWLNKGQPLDDAAQAVFRAALLLHPDLSPPIVAAMQPSITLALPSPEVLEVLSLYRPWDLTTPLGVAQQQTHMVPAAFVRAQSVTAAEQWKRRGPWVNTQVVNITTWVTRALSSERWRAVSPGSQGYSQSAVEVAKIVNDALEALAAMRLPVQPQALDSLTAGLESSLQRYARVVREKVGTAARFIPPAPPPTRFKKPSVVKQETAEADALKGRKANLALVFMESVPKIDTTSEAALLTPDIICTCLISLHYLLAKTDTIVETLSRMFDTATPSSTTSSQQHHPPAATSPAPAGEYNPFSDDQRGSNVSGSNTCGAGGGAVAVQERQMAAGRNEFRKGIATASEVLATKVVFWDLRHDWLEVTYRHHVTSARVDPVITRLNMALGSLCGAMPDDLKDQFVTCLLRSSAQAHERVLLDGGPCRWYTPADVPMLLEDLAKLKGLFYADGEGLARDDIGQATARLSMLLELMRLEVAPIMAALKQVCAHTPVGLAPLGSEQRALGVPCVSKDHSFSQCKQRCGSETAVVDEATLVRVLARRPDRIGSKMLKTVYKMSKKIK